MRMPEDMLKQIMEDCWGDNPAYKQWKETTMGEMTRADVRRLVDNNLPWMFLTAGERVYIKRAHRAGSSVEVLARDGRWLPKEGAKFNDGTTYRLSKYHNVRVVESCAVRKSNLTGYTYEISRMKTSEELTQLTVQTSVAVAKFTSLEYLFMCPRFKGITEGAGFRAGFPTMVEWEVEVPLTDE